MAGSKTREYHSPLRAAQAERTRQLILDTTAELVAEDGFEGLSLKEVARRSGVAERTVYRHFSDRAALEDALTERVSQRHGWGQRTQELTDLDAFPDAIRHAFDAFEREALDTRVVARMLAASGRSASDSRRRTARMLALVDDELPDLPEHERRTLAGVLQVLGSSRTWLRLHDDFDVSGTDAGPVLAWIAEVVIRELRRNPTGVAGHPEDVHPPGQ